MKYRQWLKRRSGYVVGSVVMVVGIILPAFVPVVASAAILQSRSIAMSSSKAGDTGVTYEVSFTAQTTIAAGGGVEIDFCDNSPIINATCTVTNAPTLTSATLGAVTFSGSAPGDAGTIATSANGVTWTAGTASGFSASDPVVITLNNVANPASTGTFYARITTYNSATNLATYNSATDVGTYTDDGGVALAVSNVVGVTAYVMETMTFCVSGDGGSGTYTGPTAECGASSLNTPDMTIGEKVGTSDVKALSTDAVSTGTDYAQISTNAAHGAVVSLKSDATGCGGLVLEGGPGGNCNITPQNSSAGTIAAGDAQFGLEVGAATDATGGTASGLVNTAGNYTSSKYYLDYVTGDATGVTSTYGSPLFNTNSAPISNMNVPVTFGASTSLITPAGKYTANLMMVATGTF